MNDLLGTRLGPYHLQEIIRYGGMATIYKAHQPSLDRFVAVKVMFPANDPQFAARFQREARAAAQLQHPNIVQIYDYGEQDGHFFLAMQYIDDGRSLTDLQGQPLSIDQILRLGVNILSALSHAHKRGIIHRDIKPSNILLAGDLWPMLIDFGIAKLLDDNQNLTRTGLAIGTPAYMAPEQAEGRTVDARTDLYSLGVVLYELITGQVPFSADTPMAVLMKHVYAPPPPPRSVKPEIPAMVEALLLRALAKDPASRYETADDMAAALNRMVFQLEQTHTQGTLTNLYQLGQQAYEEGHWDAAVDQLAQVVAMDPAFKDGQKMLQAAEAARERAKHESDQTPFTPADNYANELMKLAQTMESKNNLEGALTQYQAALSVAANGKLRAQLSSSIANIQLRMARNPTAIGIDGTVAVPAPPEKKEDSQTVVPLVASGGRPRWLMPTIIGAVLAVVLLVGGVAFARSSGIAAAPTATATSTALLATSTSTVAPTETIAPSATIAASATIAPSATSAPTDTPVPPTDTPIPPTDTAAPPPTDTAAPPPPTKRPAAPTKAPVKVVAPTRPPPPPPTEPPPPPPTEPPPPPPTAVPEPPTPEPPTPVPPTPTKKPKNNDGGGGGGPETP